MTDAIRKFWNRDALLLVMELRCRIPIGRQHKWSSEVIDRCCRDEINPALGRQACGSVDG